MAERSSAEQELVVEVAQIATASIPPAARAEALLLQLRRLVGFDAAWLALVNPDRPGHVTLSSHSCDGRVRDYLDGPVVADDIEIAGLTRDRPPMRAVDLPFPVGELQSWAECLIPAGFREGLAVSLFAADGRHVGFLSMFIESPRPPPDSAQALMGALSRCIAHAIDPVRALSAAARIVHGAAAGTVLTRAGNALPLPGLASSNLFAPGSPVLTVAARQLAEGAEYSAFLVPQPVPGPAGVHTRITVLAAPSDMPAPLAGVVVASPAGELYGLTRRELEVLGLLIEGWSNARIAAELVVVPRTVAAHLEHIRAKLAAPTRAHAAVRAQRAGAYIPRQLQARR